MHYPYPFPGRLKIVNYNLSTASNVTGRWGEFPGEIAELLIGLDPDVVVLTGVRKNMPAMGHHQVQDPVAFIAGKLGWKHSKFAVSSRSSKGRGGGDGSTTGVAIMTKLDVKLSKKWSFNSGGAAVAINVHVLPRELVSSPSPETSRRSPSRRGGDGSGVGSPEPGTEAHLRVRGQNYAINVPRSGIHMWLVGLDINAEDGEAQVEQARELASYLCVLQQSLPCIIAGHFNFPNGERSKGYKYLTGVRGALKDADRTANAHGKLSKNRHTFPVRMAEHDDLLAPTQVASRSPSTLHPPPSTLHPPAPSLWLHALAARSAQVCPLTTASTCVRLPVRVCLVLFPPVSFSVRLPAGLCQPLPSASHQAPALP